MNRRFPTLVIWACLGLAATLTSSYADNSTPAQPAYGPALVQAQELPPAGQGQYSDAQRAAAAQFIQACGQDKQRFCANVQPGQGQVVQCLVARRYELSPSCISFLKSHRRQ
jgi:hypothetical protein